MIKLQTLFTGNRSYLTIESSKVRHAVILKITRSIYFITTFLLLQTNLYGQYGFMFDNIKDEQGIADRYINAIIQDEKGFIWIGSEDGLTKFDGYTAIVYRHQNQDAQSLADNEIYSLCTDNEGGLWIGTRNGLSRYDSKTGIFTNFHHDKNDNNSLAANEVFGLAKDVSGNIWIATYGGGLDIAEKIQTSDHLSTGSYLFRHHKHDEKDNNSISGDRVFAIAFDKKNRAWVAADNGLNLYDAKQKKFTRFYHNPADTNSIAHTGVYKIFSAKDGSIWICGRGMLDRINPLPGITPANSITVKHYLPQIAAGSALPDWSINGFIMDDDNNGWIAANEQGVIKFSMDGNGNIVTTESYQKNISFPYSLVGEVPYCLFKDRSGIIWIGTERGISKYVPAKNRFNASSLLLEALDMPVLAMLTDDKNRLWLGSSTDTLWVIDLGHKKIIQKIRLPVNSNASLQVNVLFRSKRGDIYAGTLEQGIYVLPAADPFNTKELVNISKKQFPQLATNNIYAIAEDKAGFICIGTSRGLYTYDPAKKTVEQVVIHPTTSNAASAYIIRTLYMDDDVLWCGTDDGLHVLNNGRLQHTFRNSSTDSNSINDNRIISIMADHDKRIWVSTSAGINLYNKAANNFERLPGLKDMSQEAIKILAQDRLGNIWMGANHGLIKYGEKGDNIYRYGLSDGLCSEEFQRNAKAIDSNGIFYFGTLNGIVSFDPAQIKPNNLIPPVVITNISIMNKDLSQQPDTALVNTYKRSKKLLLRYDQNFFSFEFAALNYTNTTANTYAYMLEGIDKQWIQAGNNRFAGYTDIKPGHYLFKVKAANNDGIWNEVPATVAVYIAAPWWQTWWFYTLCAILVCTVIYMIYRIRLQQVLKLHTLRSSIARDLHDDVGSALSSIALLSNMAGGKHTTLLPTEQALSRIGQTSRKMIDLMDDIVWSVNPDNDRFSNMLVRMREYAVEMLETKNIAFTFNIAEHIHELKLPMQMRKDYFLIFKEAIHNLAKYAEATEANVIIERNGHQVKTEIRDNGKGFDTGLVNSGNGLKNMQARAAALNGRLIITTTPGKGTTVMLQFTVT